MFAKLAALALVATAVIGGHAAPVAQPVTVAQVQEVDHYSAARMRQSAWVASKLDEAGIIIPANVTIMFNDSTDNCGDQLGETGFGGGCTIHFHDGTVSVLLSASLPTDQYGAHILFHELGHALHNLGECAAEYYAHNYDHTPTVWSYMECRTA
jgi:hypothetical protein